MAAALPKGSTSERDRPASALLRVPASVEMRTQASQRENIASRRCRLAGRYEPGMTAEQSSVRGSSAAPSGGLLGSPDQEPELLAAAGWRRGHLALRGSAGRGRHRRHRRRLGRIVCGHRHPAAAARRQRRGAGGAFVGFGASGRNGGLLSPLPAPVWLLTAKSNADHAWALRTLNAKVHELGAWLGETVPDSEIRTCTLQLQAMGRLTAQRGRQGCGSAGSAAASTYSMLPTPGAAASRRSSCRPSRCIPTGWCARSRRTRSHWAPASASRRRWSDRGRARRRPGPRSRAAAGARRAGS